MTGPKVTIRRGAHTPNEPAKAEPEAPAPSAPSAPADKYAPDAKGVVRFEDSAGRVIGVKRPNPLERVRFAEILGPESATNQVAVLNAMPAYMVIELDGEPVARARSRRELDAMLLRLDDAGMEAVEAWIAFDMAPKIKAAMEAEEAARAEQEERAALKN